VGERVRKPDNSIKKDKAFQKKTDRRREKARFMERQSGEERRRARERDLRMHLQIDSGREDA